MQQSGALFIGSEIYRGSSYGAKHPLRVPRVSTVIDLGRALGLLAGRYRASPRAKPAALTAFHHPAYIAALQEAEATGDLPPAARARFHLGSLSNPIFPQIYSRPATGAGGVLLAAELLAKGGAIYVPGGGTHHGMADRANGFCYLNDPVLAILALRRAGHRVAYVDLDAHHCDGVEAGLAGAEGVLLISVHEAARWPFTGATGQQGNCVNLAVPAGYHDSEARMVLHELILPLLQAFKPDAIVLQAGADSLLEDPLSRLALSNNAYVEALRAITPLAPRLLLLGGGGYNPWSVGRCWTRLWAELSGQELPEVLPEPARAVLTGLSWGGGGRPLPEAGLLTTLFDPAREGRVNARLRAEVAALRQGFAQISGLG
ncbi:acetoin utilization protein AcuC [Cypionkella sp.]|uniref:acetoin utilization protein AcuC n=1 Tax=Cypionkella sp. TaxID=2811411 RepID=UPI002FDD61A4